MHSNTIFFGVLLSCVLLVAGDFDSSEEDFNVGQRRCGLVGETFTHTKPDGYSMSCVCQAPPTTTSTTTQATTTSRFGRHPRPRPTPRPHNSWACSTTQATTTTAVESTATAAPTTAESTTTVETTTSV